MKKTLLLLFTFLTVVLNAQNVIKPIGITQDLGSSCDDASGCFLGITRDNLINSSGIDPEPIVLADLAGTIHGDLFANCFATSDDDPSGYFNSFGNVRFTFDLGGTFNLTHLSIWGYWSGGSTVDPKDMIVEFSVDGGNTFSNTENVISPTPLGTANGTFAFSTARQADHVRLTVTSNHGGSRVGFGEVRFVGSSSLSVDDLNVSELKLYPNPTSEFIYLSNIKEKTNIKIFDVLGKQLKNVELDYGSAKIDVEELNSGIYFMSINSGMRTLKFIKK